MLVIVLKVSGKAQILLPEIYQYKLIYSEFIREFGEMICQFPSGKTVLCHVDLQRFPADRFKLCIVLD